MMEMGVILISGGLHVDEGHTNGQRYVFLM